MNPFQRWRLPNGLTVLYRQSPGVPLAAATLLLRTGSRDETSRQAGLASLTTDLMMQGTRKRSARRIAEEIESIGASLERRRQRITPNWDLSPPSRTSARSWM